MKMMRGLLVRMCVHNIMHAHPTVQSLTWLTDPQCHLPLQWPRRSLPQLLFHISSALYELTSAELHRFVTPTTSCNKSLLSCVPQENRPKGTSVLQLTVTDRDASHNGPPFAFVIADGNDGDVFHINQQGALVAVGVLNRKSKEHYLLQAQVSHRTEEKPELRGCIDLTVKPQQADLFVFSSSLSLPFLCHAHPLSISYSFFNLTNS